MFKLLHKYTHLTRSQSNAQNSPSKASMVHELWTYCGKFLKRWEYQTTLPTSGEICMQVKKQQLELDVEQQTGPKSVKEYVRAVYCHPAYLTYMQSTSCEYQAGWSTSWNQDCKEKYQ